MVKGVPVLPYVGIALLEWVSSLTRGGLGVGIGWLVGWGSY